MNIFEVFSEDLAEGAHDLNADTLEFYLTNATPSLSADAVAGDLAEIATGNGYTGPIDSQNATSRTGNITSVTGVDANVTAAGGAVATFRYVVLKNATNLDKLIGYWDYGSAVSLGDGEGFDIDVGTSMFTVAPAA